MDCGGGGRFPVTLHVHSSARIARSGHRAELRCYQAEEQPSCQNSVRVYASCRKPCAR